MPFLVGLTEEERRRLPMIRVQNKIFVDEAVRQVLDNPDMVPDYFESTEMVKDLVLHDDLLALERRLKSLYYKVVHTRMLAGSEAFQAALAFYRMAKAAYGSGVPGSLAIVESLRDRFSAMGPVSAEQEAEGSGPAIDSESEASEA